MRPAAGEKKETTTPSSDLSHAAVEAGYQAGMPNSGIEKDREKYERALQHETEIKHQLARLREANVELKATLLRAAIDWLEQKWGDRSCPYCGETAWQVGTPLQLQLFPDEVMSPAFPVMCGNCGHTTFVNAVLAGIVPEGFELPEDLDT